jgi:hypothetical protein
LGVKVLSMPSFGRAVGPVSQICGTLKNPCDYLEVGVQGEILSPISLLSFPLSLTEGSALVQHGRPWS